MRFLSGLKGKVNSKSILLICWAKMEIKVIIFCQLAISLTIYITIQYQFHCFFLLCQNVIRGLPLVNYPDVCTNSPQSGKAFCVEHMKFLNEKYPDVPTDIHGFLRYCGIQRENTDTVTVII